MHAELYFEMDLLVAGLPHRARIQRAVGPAIVGQGLKIYLE